MSTKPTLSAKTESEEVKPKRAPRASTATTAKEPAAKPETKRAPRAKTQATVKPKPEVKPPVVKEEPEPKKDTMVEEDDETVEIQSENKVFNETDDLELIGTGISSMGVKKIAKVNYEFVTRPHDVLAVDGTAPDGGYPLGVWVRDPKPLQIMAAAAGARLQNGTNTEGDFQMLSFADENSINDDHEFMNVTARPNAVWDNALHVGTRKVRNSRVNYQPGTIDNAADRIVAVLGRRLGLGTPILVRLWHSGIVFTINPPERASVIAMSDTLNAAHLDTLRRTNGLIHGTSSYYANRIICTEFMKHVTASNIDQSHWPNILKLMDHRDIQFMALGLQAASHPRGYNMVEVCGGLRSVKHPETNLPVLNEDGKERKVVCTHRTESNIDFRLLGQIDNSMFTDYQRELIARPLSASKLVSLEEIEVYQSQGTFHQPVHVELENGLVMIIKAPKANTHIEIGEEWIQMAEDIVDNIITNDTDVVSKNEAINRQIEATSAMDVAHWVHGFEVDGELVTNRTGIDRVFRQLGNNREQSERVFTMVRENIAKNIAAIVAIPTYKCSECGTLSNTIANNGNAFYTPLDMVSRFFILADRNQ